MNDFTINFEYKGNTPIYKQLYDFLLSEINSGNLKENEKLPSRRALCNHLKISKNTVEAAYQKLAVEGYIVSVPRSGFYVRSYDKDSRENTDEEKVLFDFKYNFSINGIDILKMPYEMWAKMYKDVIYENPGLFNHGEKFGEYILRKAIVKYIHEFRGVRCTAKQIIIGSGIDYLIIMLNTLFEKNTVYGFENPCNNRIYELARIFDKNIFLLDVTEKGFNMDALRKSNIDIIYVMPSNQYPMGYGMSAEARKELLDWAEEKDGRYIIEDDYDSEFIYDKRPVVSIQCMDKNEKVIYIGGFSKSIAPTINISYIVLPQHLADKWKKSLYACYVSVNLFEQRVLAEFIKNGYFAKHVRNMKTIYMKKRDFLINEIRKSAFGDKVRLYGDMNGTHFLLKFDTSRPECELIDAAKKNGVKIIPLSRHFLRKTGFYDRKILIFGFGGLTEFEIEDAVRLLEDAWKDF